MLELGLLRRRSRQRSGSAAPLGWEMTVLSGNRMADWQGRLAGRLREGGLSNSLVGLFQNSTDNQSEGPLGEWKGIKHMVRMKYDCKVTVLK